MTYYASTKAILFIKFYNDNESDSKQTTILNIEHYEILNTRINEIVYFFKPTLPFRLYLNEAYFT